MKAPCPPNARYQTLFGGWADGYFQTTGIFEVFMDGTLGFSGRRLVFRLCGHSDTGCWGANWDFPVLEDGFSLEGAFLKSSSGAAED